MIRLPPGPRGVIVELALWALFAAALLAPASVSLGSSLIGDPRIDVWNHAWGYWFVAEALGRGALPWDTPLVGAPAGGVLYYIDMMGAVLATPLTWTLGPGPAYNLTLLLRVALAGFAARGLAGELTGRGPHTVLAGVAYASTPFLLSELANGISEVCATQWLAFTLWAAARAFRRGGWSDYALLGLAQGLTSVSTFYYGLCSAILVAVAFVGWRGARWRDGLPPPLVGRVGLAAALALVLITPQWAAFRASLTDPRALIVRDPSLNQQLMVHSAVDPRIFFLPGDFQSVDLAGIYGEPFLHTGYLRLSVLGLALYGAWARPRARPWLALGALSLVLGMGPFLWWGGDWARVDGNLLSLPFEWLRQLLPQVAITHPLRLSLGAQALFCALAAAGAGAAVERLRRPALLPAFAVVVALEGLFGSSAPWPVPRSDARLSGLYDGVGDGLVLELPVEVGTGMLTSRYFWSQTRHGRPVPFTPDVRMGSTRDATLVKALSGPSGRGGVQKDNPSPLSPAAVQHLRQTYAIVVLHLDLEAEAGLQGRYEPVLTAALGEPAVEGQLRVWRLR